MIKQPFGGVVRDIAPEGDGRGTTLEVGGEVFISGIVVVEQESPVVVGQPQKRMEGVHSAFAPLKRLLRLGGGFWQERFPVPLVRTVSGAANIGPGRSSSEASGRRRFGSGM